MLVRMPGMRDRTYAVLEEVKAAAMPLQGRRSFVAQDNGLA